MRMFRYFWLVALMVVIAGCAGLPGSDNISANLDGPAGFEVTDDGDEATIEIHVNEVTFKNQAGAPEAHIHSYEVQVLDASGNLVAEADNIGMEDAFQVTVPAGKRCLDEDTDYCPKPGEYYTTTRESEPRDLMLIASFVPTYILDNDLQTVRLRVTFHYYYEGKSKNKTFSAGVPAVYPR